MSEIAELMKRCQRGVGGRNALDEAHDIMAECYGTLGRLEAERDALAAELAAIKGQQPVCEVSEETFSSDGTSDIITCNLPIGTKLYPLPAASVPAGFKVVPVELLEDLRDLAADAVEHHRAACAGYKKERQARMDKTVAEASALLASAGQEVGK